jgi:hypothetical protein
MLASCSTNSNAPTNSSMPESVTVEDLGVFVSAARTGVQLLHSRIDQSLYAVTCDGGSSLKIDAGTDVIVSSEDARVVFTGDEISFPAGQDGFELRVAKDDSAAIMLVRCLPASFPRLSVEGMFTDSLALTMMPVGNLDVFPDKSKRKNIGSFRVVLDASGFPVWFQEIAGALVADFTVEEDGSLFSFNTEARDDVATSEEKGIGAINFDLSGEILKSWTPTDFDLDFHAAVQTPSGTLIALRYVLSDKVLSPTMGVINPIIQEGTSCPARAPSGTEQTWRGEVIEIAQDGNVVKSWNMNESLPDSLTTALWVNLNPFEGPMECTLDAEHLNAVQYLADTNRVLVTARHIDGVVMLDWASNEVLWTLGGNIGPDSLRIINDPLGGPSLPHDANMLDENHMLLFDNNPRKGSRAVIYRIDEANRTATFVSSYTPRFGEEMIGSFAMGSARRSLDGSGFVLGLGTSPIASVEFALGESEPRASLTLDDRWTYRVLPVRDLDMGKAWTAMNNKAQSK